MQDKLLITPSDLQNITGNLSLNVDDSQIEPYIREAQTGELRRFLGDELYLELLNGYTPGQLPFGFNLLVNDGGFVPFTGATNTWTLGQGWDFTFPSASAIEQTFDFALPVGTYVPVFKVNAGTSSGDNASIQIFDKNLNAVDSEIVSWTTSGEYTGSTGLVIGTELESGWLLRIAMQAQGNAGTCYLEDFNFQGNTSTEVYYDLMTGTDYVNRQGRTVRFNGLEEVLKYWSWYRYIRNSDMVNLRFGNRLAQDGIYSDALTREQIKRVSYNAKSLAIKFQSDAHDFIEANIEDYDAYRRNHRIPKRRAFEFNKIPGRFYRYGSRGAAIGGDSPLDEDITDLEFGLESGLTL